jgi:hypothetical protein
VKKLGLGGDATFQLPLPENLYFCCALFYLTSSSCIFFTCVDTSLGFVCVVFFNVLYCLDFGVWIIKLNFFHFSLLFPPPFLTLTLFFLFFPFCFFPLNLLSCCYLTILSCLVLLQTTTSSPHPAMSTYYLITLPLFVILMKEK